MQKRWILITLFLCMIGTGVAYAGWTQTLSIDMHVKLGGMEIELPKEQEAYRMEFLNKKGKTVREMGIDEVNFLEDGGLKLYMGKKKAISMEKGWDDVDSVRFLYPLLEKEGNSIKNIQVGKKEEVELVCTKAWILDGKERRDLESGEYKKVVPDIVFKDTRTFEKNGNTMEVVHKLQLTKESREAIRKAQKKMVSLECLDKNETQKKAQLYMVYSFETNLQLQQKQEKAEKAVPIAYAYWTKQYKIKGDIQVYGTIIMDEKESKETGKELQGQVEENVVQ